MDPEKLQRAEQRALYVEHVGKLRESLEQVIADCPSSLPYLDKFMSDFLLDPFHTQLCLDITSTSSDIITQNPLISEKIQEKTAGQDMQINADLLTDLAVRFLIIGKIQFEIKSLAIEESTPSNQRKYQELVLSENFQYLSEERRRVLELASSGRSDFLISLTFLESGDSYDSIFDRFLDQEPIHPVDSVSSSYVTYLRLTSEILLQYPEFIVERYDIYQEIESSTFISPSVKDVLIPAIKRLDRLNGDRKGSYLSNTTLTMSGFPAIANFHPEMIDYLFQNEYVTEEQYERLKNQIDRDPVFSFASLFGNDSELVTELEVAIRKITSTRTIGTSDYYIDILHCLMQGKNYRGRQDGIKADIDSIGDVRYIALAVLPDILTPEQFEMLRMHMGKNADKKINSRIAKIFRELYGGKS